MKRVGVIANCEKPRSADVLCNLAGVAAELGLELFAADPVASLLGISPVSSEEMLERVEAVIALGGDGTMLRAQRELGTHDIPILGVNIGGLGFLTSVAEDMLGEAVRCLAEDDFELRTTAVAECTVLREGKEASTWRVLNDVVITNGSTSRVITLDVSIDGKPGTSYVCDGVIVATPSGSTGHSLSAGGPILTPETPAFVISIICPHTLSSRPLVVPDRSEICIVGRVGTDELLLTGDGQVEESLACGDRVIVRRSSQDVRFIRLPGYSYFSVLQQKLGWSGSSMR